jgi:YegS/Rv2252/BmrU family lipid kinase
MRNGEKEQKSIYVVLNPIAGHASADELRKSIESRLNTGEHLCEIYLTTGKEDIGEITRRAVEQGSSMVVAAGGDGTVTGVVTGLLHTDVPLGIIPVGTGNGLARALGIPLDPMAAIDLLVGPHLDMKLDAMGVNNDVFVLNVSAGISARAMKETPSEEKRRFGVIAYAWTILRNLLGYGPMRYQLTIDNHEVRIRATEVLVSNGALLREPSFPLGPRQLYQDGKFDVYILTARSLIDYLKIIWNFIAHAGKGRSDLRHLSVEKMVAINSLSSPQPVQADGEVIGQTPVEVKVIPSAIRVVVPEVAPGEEKQ